MEYPLKLLEHILKPYYNLIMDQKALNRLIQRTADNVPRYFVSTTGAEMIMSDVYSSEHIKLGIDQGGQPDQEGMALEVQRLRPMETCTPDGANERVLEVENGVKPSQPAAECRKPLAGRGRQSKSRAASRDVQKMWAILPIRQFGQRAG